MEICTRADTGPPLRVTQQLWNTKSFSLITINSLKHRLFCNVEGLHFIIRDEQRAIRSSTKLA